MSGERQFLLNRKDADFLSVTSFSRGIAGENESRFRKIHLARQRLHLGVAQSASVSKDGQRITCERRLREYIKLNEFVSARRHESDLECVESRVSFAGDCQRARRTVLPRY